MSNFSNLLIVRNFVTKNDIVTLYYQSPQKIFIVTLTFVKMSRSFSDKGKSLITLQLTAISKFFFQIHMVWQKYDSDFMFTLRSTLEVKVK